MQEYQYQVNLVAFINGTNTVYSISMTSTLFLSVNITFRSTELRHRANLSALFCDIDFNELHLQISS